MIGVSENYFLSSHYDLALSDYNYFFFVDNWFLTDELKTRIEIEGLQNVNL
jgi:hypothetical protein